MRILLLLFVLFSLGSCREDSVFTTPNVEHIDVEFTIHRYDQALLQMDTFAPIRALQQLSGRYPVLTDLYIDQIIGLSAQDSSFKDRAKDVRDLVEDSRMRFILDTIQQIYPNLNRERKEFELAFKYLKYYFPEVDVPDIYTLASEYTVGNFIFQDEEGNNALGVGLDFFLGSDYPYHIAVPNNTAFSRYLTRTFNFDHIVKKTLTPLIQDWMGRPKGSRLLDKMIHDGKERYILDRLLPFQSDTVIHEYSLDQLQFCKENEADIWAFFLTEDLLYTQEPHKVNKYINPAPTSSGMPAGAPGRTGGYIGYRIVEQFMRRNPEVSLPELIKMEDAQEIMTRSKYRPRK